MRSFAGGSTLKFRLFRGHPSTPVAPPDPRFPKECCVLALLVAAAHADGDVAPEEEIEIDALLVRARSMIAMSPEQVDRCVTECRDIMRGQNSVSSLVTHACRQLPVEDGLGEAVFAHCVDIALADRKLLLVEREFLDDMAEALHLPKALTDKIVTVMSWKNAF